MFQSSHFFCFFCFYLNYFISFFFFWFFWFFFYFFCMIFGFLVLFLLLAVMFFWCVLCLLMWFFLFWFSTKTILTNMRVRLTHLFDFWFENHASQAMSTENFPFWVQENGLVLENKIVFEKIVNLSKNFQKLFFKQSMLNEHGTYPRDAQPRIGGNGKLPLVWGMLYSNGKLPLVWMATHGNRKLPLVWITPQHTVVSLH